MKPDKILFFNEIDFCKPNVIPGLDLNLVCTSLFFKKVQETLKTKNSLI